MIKPAVSFVKKSFKAAVGYSGVFFADDRKDEEENKWNQKNC